jgi:hypothetical protein
VVSSVQGRSSSEKEGLSRPPQRRFLISEMLMKPTTRDNLIYLAVGISIAAIVAADAFYADSHGRKMWMPSKFAFRLVSTTALLGYFVARETHKVKATFVQLLACVLFATVVHLAIGFGFRQAFGQLSGMSFSAWAVLEMYLLVMLSFQVIQHLKSG